jgi:hypothetical protein
MQHYASLKSDGFSKPFNARPNARKVLDIPVNDEW